MNLKKVTQREKAIRYCEGIGVKRYYVSDGEGRHRNNTYYQIELINGEFGYLKNLTDEQKDRLDVSCNPTK